MALGWRDYVAGDFEQAAQRFRRILDLTPESHREAERLLLAAKRTTLPLRAADALHLALAIQAGARGIVTFDLRMARAAVLAGSLEIHPAL